MQSMLSELRILFGLNVAFSVIVRCCVALVQSVFASQRLCQVLYYSTFLRTVGNVVQQVISWSIARCVGVTVLILISQARLSRIFLSTIPLEAISKVIACVCLKFVNGSVIITTQVQAEHLRSLFFPNSQEDF